MKKIKAKYPEVILVVPFWPNQPWFPLIFKMLTDALVLLTSRKHLLHLSQHPQTVHSIWRKMDLLVCHLAGSSQKTAGYLKKLQASSKHHGDVLQCCLQRNVNPAQAFFKIGIEYLTQYFYTGVDYSSVKNKVSTIFHYQAWKWNVIWGGFFSMYIIKRSF